MSSKHLGIASIAVLAASFWLASSFRAHGDDAPAGQEVLTHGPVHEAFAEPTGTNPTPTIIVPKQPPAAIEEMPPDVKPDGANVVWVAGYWAWDDTRDAPDGTHGDYIWISGIWRDTPPGYVWVAGYWNQAANGSQWTPGFWSPAQQEQVNYLPEPPPTQEAGPNIPQPDANDFWVPGNYQYVETRYVWRPGYWTVGRPDWIWTPAHYVWTPSGYIFIPGHWDYILAHRGVLFAPVYFSSPIYVRPRYVFAPSVVIDANLLTVNFFVRPSYCHYYFGDYYGENFVALGFNPWFSVGVHVGYDPLFAYYRWDHRGDRRWEGGLHEHFTYMNSHPDSRPPRTFVQQTTIVNNITINKNSNNKNIAIGAPLNQYVKNVNATGGNNVKFVNVSNQQRQQIAQESLKSQDITRERAKFEAAPGGGKTGPLTGGPGAGGSAKSLNLHTLAKSTGGELPGAAGAAAAGGAASGRGSSGIGSTFPGAGGTVSGRGPTGIGGTATTGTGGARGTNSGRGPTGLNGTSTTGTGGAGSRTTGGGSDPFRLKSGDTLKSGSTGPAGGSGVGASGPGGGKSSDIFKGAAPSFTPSGGKGSGTPSGGKGSGPPPQPAPSGRGSGDSRGNGKNDKNGQGDSRSGRTTYKPLDGSEADGSQARNPRPDDQPNYKTKDPVGPLKISPSLGGANRGSNGPAVSRDTVDSQPPARVKDPVRPLNIAPQPQPQPQGRKSDSSNGPPAKGNNDANSKDPVGPLRIIPPNR